MSINACSSIAGSWKYHAYSSFEPLSHLQDNQRELIQKIAPCQVRKEVWTDGRTYADVITKFSRIDRKVSIFYSNGGSATRARRFRYQLSLVLLVFLGHENFP